MNTMPPASLRLERAMLGALLVANWPDRDKLTAELSTSDFHDPWHQWVFKVLRHWRRGTGDVLQEFELVNRDIPAPIGSCNLQHELCLLLVRIDVEPDCGQVNRLRRMAGDLRALAMQRTKQIELETKLMSVVNESLDLIAEGENAI